MNDHKFYIDETKDLKIDLTEIFGKGNEPSIEAIEDLLQYSVDGIIIDETADYSNEDLNEYFNFIEDQLDDIENK